MGYIKFNIDGKLKKDFIKKCDGRSMTHVLIKLIMNYIYGNDEGKVIKLHEISQKNDKID